MEFKWLMYGGLFMSLEALYEESCTTWNIGFTLGLIASVRFYGPYKIIQKVGKVAYKLELPPTSLIHPVFHVSQLKKAIGAAGSSDIPPQLTASLEMQAHPSEVLEVRQMGAPSAGQWEVLIGWKDLSISEATWEDFDKMKEIFPDFNLEDKVNLVAAGNVMPNAREQGIITYQRRRKGSNNKA